MHPVWEGIKLGLMLSCLVGPLFFALIQSGAEHGIRGGTVLGLGIWISDILFVAGVYWGLASIQQITRWPAFTLTMGLGGSLILAAFGLFTLLSKPKMPGADEALMYRKAHLPALWLKGFLINTVNPFTFFFWIGISGVMIIEEKLSSNEAFQFFAAILSTIILTDFAKVVLAKRISHRFRPVHFLWLRRLSGAALVIFGLVMLIKVWWLG